MRRIVVRNLISSIDYIGLFVEKDIAMRVVLLIPLFILSCGLFQKKDNKPQITIQPVEVIRAKADRYKALAVGLEAENGVLPQFKCDSLLFQSFYELSTDGDLDMSIYEGDPGQWFRSPSHDCFYRDVIGEPVRNGSKTTISRDMFLGFFTYILFHRDLDAAESILTFGRNAQPRFFMGDGVNFLERETRTHLRPSIRGTLYHLIAALGGEDNPRKNVPYLPSATVNGYQLHLMVTHTLLRGLILDGVSDKELAVLKKATDKQPENAYYHAVYHLFKDGDQSRAIQILLDESLFPADRLPSGQDRCSDYIFQRDDDRGDPDPDKDDWKPCSDGSNETHPPVDFLWTVRVIENPPLVR